MTVSNQISLFLLIIAIVSSCGGATHHIAKSNFSTKENYEVNDYYGCCGCEAKYFMIYEKTRKKEQVIYSYNCGGTGEPTKFIFNYNHHGRLINYEQYIATVDNNYTMKVSDQEKLLFVRLDTNIFSKPNNKTIALSKIKGFRKPFSNEMPHAFPLIKKGHKVAVR